MAVQRRQGRTRAARAPEGVLHVAVQGAHTGVTRGAAGALLLLLLLALRLLLVVALQGLAKYKASRHSRHPKPVLVAVP